MVKWLRNPATGEASEQGVSCVAIQDYKGRRLIATGTTKGHIKIIDGASGQVAFLQKDPLRHDEKVCAIHFTVDGGHGQDAAFQELKLCTCSADRRAHEWNIRTGERILSMGSGPGAHTGTVTCMMITSIERRDLRMEGGRRVAVTGSVDRSCRLWSCASDDRCLRVYEGHEATVTDVVICGDRNHEILISTSMDHTVRVWHLSSEDCLCVLEHGSSVMCLAFHETLMGGAPAVVTGAYGDAKVWRLPQVESDTREAWDDVLGARRQLVQAFAETEGRVHRVAVTTLFDRREMVVTASRDTVNFWAPALDADGVREPFTLEWLVSLAASGIVHDLCLRPHAFFKPATAFTEPVAEDPGDLTADVTLRVVGACGLAQMDSRKALDPYVVVRVIRAGEKKPTEVGRTIEVQGSQDPTWDPKSSTFTLQLPIYKPCDVVLVVYDHDRKRGKHLACGQVILLASELLNEDADPFVTKHLLAMGAKQVDVFGALTVRVDIEDAPTAGLGLEVVCACANGTVDHALLFDLPPMPPPDPVIEVEEAPVLELARVLHPRRHEPRGGTRVGRLQTAPLSVVCHSFDSSTSDRLSERSRYLFLERARAEHRC